MTEELIDIVRSRGGPLEPKPTHVEPRLNQLPKVRAVLFDIYGTLMISASGDIGSDDNRHRDRSLQQVLEQLDLRLTCGTSDAIRLFNEEVLDAHAREKANGISYPEVDFREIWSAVLSKTIDIEKSPGYSDDGTKNELDRFSLEFEMRVNPTWPMPGAEETLSQLRDLEFVLGIVSNAQFFTPLLFSAFLGRDLESLGVSKNLTYFSYEHRQAKPGTELYELVRSQLEALGIPAGAVLYVGNDMLNDVAAACHVGFRTALFAGDQRSLRLRTDDDRVHGVEADIVVTELPQLLQCLPPT